MSEPFNPPKPYRPSPEDVLYYAPNKHVPSPVLPAVQVFPKWLVKSQVERVLGQYVITPDFRFHVVDDYIGSTLDEEDDTVHVWQTSTHTFVCYV